MGSSLKISTIRTVFCNSTFYFIQLVRNNVDNKFRHYLKKTNVYLFMENKTVHTIIPVQHKILTSHIQVGSFQFTVL